MEERAGRQFCRTPPIGRCAAAFGGSGNSILEKSYLSFFVNGPIELIAFEVEAAKRYAEIRSRARIRPADAIQLACAAAARTDLFVTNDNRLSGVVVSGITFITGIERIPY